MQTFNEIQLHSLLLKSLEQLKFEKPTEIQAQSLPLLLEGKDLIAQSRTGSGKTAAYLLPILQRILTAEQDVPVAPSLVLVPTRELATQVEVVAKQLGKNIKFLRLACVYGGASMGLQKKLLSQKPQLIIATPGRLMDHLRRRNVNLKQVQTLVLDEADRMLDMGFHPQITEIVEQMEGARQTCLFSATYTREVKNLARTIMTNPEEVAVGEENVAPVTIEQKSVETTRPQKTNLLVDELNKRTGSVLIFAQTQDRTDIVAGFLDDAGFDVESIHGGRSQYQRRQALESFRRGSVRILVATDVAARGLDIKHVEHVINYDIPMNPEDYLHRIGRTGRAGASGQALSFVTREDWSYWRSIILMMSRKNREAGVDNSQIESLTADLSFARNLNSRGGDDRPSRGGFRGGRSFGGNREGGRGGFRSEGRGGFNTGFSRGPRSEGGFRGERSFGGARDGGRRFNNTEERPSRFERKPREEFGTETRSENSGEERSFNRGERNERGFGGERNSRGFNNGGERRSFDRDGSRFGGPRRERSFGGDREGGREDRGGFKSERRSGFNSGFSRGPRSEGGRFSGGGEGRRFNGGGDKPFAKRDGGRFPKGENSFSRSERPFVKKESEAPVRENRGRFKSEEGSSGFQFSRKNKTEKSEVDSFTAFQD